MKELNSKQRQYLKGLAHKLKPVMIIGHNGITDTLIKGLKASLNYHELLKIKFGDFKDKKDELSEQLAVSTGATLVGRVGNIAILYREQKNEKKRKIFLERKKDDEKNSSNSR